VSGWSTITLEPNADSEGPDEYYGRRSLEADLLEELNEREVYGTVVSHQRGAVAEIGGYRDWSEDISILESLGERWERAVVIQANDTSDVGDARYFEHAQEGWVSYDSGEVACLNSFEENELVHGRPVGSLAASQMQVQHGIPCLASIDTTKLRFRKTTDIKQKSLSERGRQDDLLDNDSTVENTDTDEMLEQVVRELADDEDLSTAVQLAVGISGKSYSVIKTLVDDDEIELGQSSDGGV
jgi:hypothetical protein